MLAVAGCSVDAGDAPGEGEGEAPCAPEDGDGRGVLAVTEHTSDADRDDDGDGNAMPESEAVCAVEFGLGFRAVLHDGVRRHPPRNGKPIDWPIEPGVRYERPDGVFVAEADGVGLLPFPLAAPISPEGREFHTGMSQGWRPNSDCADWTDSEPSGVAFAHGGEVTDAAMFAHGDCWEPRALLCAGPFRCLGTRSSSKAARRR